MRSQRSAYAVALTLVVVLAGCNGLSSTGPPTTPSSAPETTSTSTPERRATTTTTPNAGPGLSIAATGEDLQVQVTIYNSTFISGPPIFSEAYQMDAGEQVYLTGELAGLEAARVVVTVNDTEVWNESLALWKGYVVTVNETDAAVATTAA